MNQIMDDDARETVSRRRPGWAAPRRIRGHDATERIRQAISRTTSAGVLLVMFGGVAGRAGPARSAPGRCRKPSLFCSIRRRGSRISFDGDPGLVRCAVAIAVLADCHRDRGVLQRFVELLHGRPRLRLTAWAQVMSADGLSHPRRVRAPGKPYPRGLMKPRHGLARARVRALRHCPSLLLHRRTAVRARS